MMLVGRLAKLARRFDRVGFLQRLHIINAGSMILVNDVGGAFS